MKGISFTIVNPNSIPTPGQPEIYYDKPAESNLRFGFTQDLGISSIKPEDSVRISFPASLLEAMSKEMLASKDWEVKKLEAPGVDNQQHYIFNLSPTTELPFKEDELRIDFQKVLAKKASNGEVSINIVIDQSQVPIVDDTQKLIVMAYPDKPKDLTDSTLFPSILFNDDQETIESHAHLAISIPALTPPIANQLTLNLKYEKKGLFVEKWDTKDPKNRPFFNISFSYGSSANDLTDDIQFGKPDYNQLTTVMSIKATIKESHLWKLEKATDTSLWKITPTDANTNLFSGKDSNLDISFTHIISRLPEGDATIYIQWGNIPGYNEGWKARNIPKKSPVPKILAFSALGGSKTESIPFGAGINLDWSVFAVAQVQLRCDETPFLNGVYKVPATKVEAALFYCGGVRPEAAKTTESCASLITRKIIPIDPVSSFYLQALNAKGEKTGEEVGPVTIKLKDYPDPTLNKKLQAEGAIFKTEENKEPVYYFNQPGASVSLNWELKNQEVVKEIILLDPTGDTIKTLLPENKGKARISLQKEGRYTIRIIGKDKGEFSQGIILRTVSNLLIGANYASGISYKGSIPMPGLVYVISSYDNKKGNYKPIKTLIYSYPSGIFSLNNTIQLAFTKAGSGTISFTPPNCSLAYPNITVPQMITISKQPQLNTQLLKVAPIPPQNFEWSISTMGNINIQLGDSKWELVLSKDANSQQLTFQSATTQLPLPLNEKIIALSNITASLGNGEIPPFSIELTPVSLTNTTVNIKAEEMTFVFKKNRFQCKVSPSPFRIRTASRKPTSRPFIMTKRTRVI